MFKRELTPEQKIKYGADAFIIPGPEDFSHIRKNVRIYFIKTIPGKPYDKVVLVQRYPITYNKVFGFPITQEDWDNILLRNKEEILWDLKPSE